MALLGQIQEPFTGTATPTGWTETDITLTVFTYSSQGVSIALPAATTSSTDGDLNFTATNDLTGSFARLNVTGVSGASATHTDNVLRVRQNSSNYYTIFYEAGTLFFSKVVTSAQTNIASVTYNATTHAWWQIRHKGASVYGEFSADGKTWTQLGVDPTAITITACDVLIGAICFGIDTNPSPFAFKYFNYPLPGTSTSTSSTSISSTSSSTSSTSSSISSTSISSTSASTSTSSTSTSLSSTSSSTSSTSTSFSSTSSSSTSSSTSISSTSSSISSTSTSSTSTSSTSSSTSISSTSTSISSTSSSFSSTSVSTSSTSFSSTSSSSSTSTTTLPPPYLDYSYQDSLLLPTDFNTAGFEKGTNGNTISISDTGDATVWTAVTLGTGVGVTCAYDTTHTHLGTQAAKIATASTANTSRLEWNITATTHHFGRIYLYFTALPAAEIRLYRMAQSSASHAASIAINTSGQFIFYDQGVNSLGTTVNKIALNRWIRMEYEMQSGTPSLLGIKLFNDADSLIPTEYKSVTYNTLTAVDFLTIQVGVCINLANVTAFWMDNIAANYPTWPGPVNELINADTALNYSDVTVDDGDYFVQSGSEYMVQNYRQKWINNTDTPSFTWRGRTTYSTLVSPMLFQIYNLSTTAWETLAVANTIPADTDFSVTVSKTTNLSNYYDSNNVVSFRSYQQVF